MSDTRHPISLHPKISPSRIVLGYKLKPTILDEHPDKKSSEKVQTCHNVPGMRDTPMPCAVVPKLYRVTSMFAHLVVAAVSDRRLEFLHFG